MQWRQKKVASPITTRPHPHQHKRTPAAGLAEEKEKKRPKLSRLHKPDDMSLEEWQTELRRQFGREQNFLIKNIGEHPVFSEFEVTNPQSQRSYRVFIRGTQPGDNYCSCPDFATNTLGTCKHIEFTLAKLERKRSTAGDLKAGFQPPYSEVYLHYGARREVRFRPGASCPVEVARLATHYFDAEGAIRPDAFARLEKFLDDAGHFDHDLRCHDDALGFVAEMRDAEQRAKRVEEAFPRGAPQRCVQGFAAHIVVRLSA